MELKSYSDIVTIVISPLLTVLAAVFGWIIVIRDSRASAHRAEATELLTLVVSTTVELNRRAASFLLDKPENRKNHRAWVSSVNVDIASLRARAAILKDVYEISISDDFFYRIRRAFTYDAEAYHEYTSDQVSQKIDMQTVQVSKILSSLYDLYPSKKSLVTWLKGFVGKTKNGTEAKANESKPNSPLIAAADTAAPIA
ncbi:hypothetical protein [Pseudomonas sp. UMAB-08]|jgi:hypothetical protein|uniref:hypothetical protein n=1 Tax=Pseudomonas sp. UMAB-08 TaxID=1365375 RepID=UPI001C586C1F|nr:hypothetical protein [Pseudomonas sp. UMAB-08]